MNFPGGLRNGSFVWTPTGFSLVENLRTGDQVIGGDGNVCQVLSVKPMPRQRCLTLIFDRGVSVTCADTQTWLALHPAARFPTRHSHGKVEPNPRFDRWGVFAAGEMLRASGDAPLPRRRFLIPSAGVAQMAHHTTPIDAYLLGALLGDGCLRNGTCYISTADHELLAMVEALLPDGVGVRYGGKYDYGLVVAGGRGHGRSALGNPLTRILRDLEVYGRLSSEKIVPFSYLFNSPAVRLALLQGLLDTDGSVSATQGSIEFSSTSRALSAAVEFLVASFGGKTCTETRITKFTDKFGARRDGAASFRVRIRLPHVVPFRLTRKIKRLVRPVSTCDERVLWSVQDAGVSDCTAFEVDSRARTMLVETGVVMHDGSAHDIRSAYTLSSQSFRI